MGWWDECGSPTYRRWASTIAQLQYSYPPKCTSLCASSGDAWERTSGNSVNAKFALFHRPAPDRVLCKQGHTPVMFKEAPARAGAQAEMSCAWGHFMQDRESELRRIPKRRSSHPALCVAPSLCGRNSYVEVTGSWPCLHKTLSGAGRWNRANFAITEFYEVQMHDRA